MVNYNNPNDIPVVDYDLSKVPEPIRKRAEGVENARYGKQNKAFLKQGIEIAGVIAQEALETASYDGNSLADVTLAKDGLPTLDARIRRDVNNLENKKADKSETTAQLAQKVDEVTFNINRQTIDFLAGDRLINAIDIAEAGNSQSVQNYIDTLVSNGQIEGVTLVRGSVTSDKMDRIEMKGNLYDYRTHLIPEHLINLQGVAQQIEGWSYGRVPINRGGTYSVWLPEGIYSSHIGSIGLYNGENQVDYILNLQYQLGEGTARIGGAYKGTNYITFIVPAGVDNIRVTNKRPGTGAFDNTQDMIIVEGDKINDTILLSTGVSKLFGVPLIDEIARTKLSEVEIKGENLYNVETDYKADYFVDVSGTIQTAVGWGHATVPIEKSGTYSLWLDSGGNYSGHIGSIALYNGSTLVDYIYAYVYRIGEGTVGFGGQYKGSEYLTFTVPEGVDNIRVTNKRGGASGTFDSSETMILIEGDTINDSVLERRITKLFGYPISNEELNENTDDISLPYEGKKWVVVGDSLTEINSRSLKFYHQYIADDLGITVHNMGQSGTGYKRSNPFYDRVSSIPTDADVVTIFGSFNDLGAGIPHGTKDDTGTDTLGGAINTTIDNLYAKLPTVPLGIISPTPWQSSQPWNDEHSSSLYAKLLKDICKDRGIPFLDLYYSSGLRPWEVNYRPLMYSRDDGNGTHPDENGHKLIYPQFREFIKTLI